MTEQIESQTSKISSGVFLSVALATMSASLVLKCMWKKSSALFVGQWASPLLIIGFYNKVVRTKTT